MSIKLEFDVSKLQEYILAQGIEISTPLEVKKFTHGQSNPTFLLIDSRGKKMVMRKKPNGQLMSKTAHAVEREYKVLTALGRNTDIPVPRTYLLCEDSSVIGTPFYVMEFLEGRVLTDPIIGNIPAEERAKYWAELVRVLAKLHSVDYKKIGLEKYGKDSGYYKRQAKSLVKVHDMQAKSIDHRTGVPVGPMPRFYEVSDYLANAYCPDEACIVHGDYKMDNVMFHKTEPRIIGILDWELSTIGNPRADLINMTQLFRHSTKPAEVDERPLNVILKEAEENYITKINDFRYEGIQSQQELVELYCKLTNRAYPLSGFEYASVFGLFRNSIIYHGIAARYANGQATSTYAKQVAVFAPGTILLAATIMDRAKKSEQNVVDSKLQSKL